MRYVQRRTGMAIIRIRMRCTAPPPYEPLYRLADLRLDLFLRPFTHSSNSHPLPFRLEAFNLPISILAHSSRDDAPPSPLPNFIKACSRQLKPSLRMWEPLLRMKLAILRRPRTAIVRPRVRLALLDLERMKQQHVADLIKYRKHHRKSVLIFYY
jgi:hypothetical protein